MSVHLVVSSAAQGVNATEVDNAFVADPTIPRNSANHLLLPGQWSLVLAYALGTSLTRARVQSAKFRQQYIPYIWPFDRAAAPPNRPNLCDWRDRPMPFLPNDELEVDVSNNLGAATEQETVGLWITQGMEPVPVGKPIYTIRGTATITGVANAWASGPITLGQSLPPGDYYVTNMQVQSATAIFARLIFPGASNGTRPGVIGSTAIQNSNGFEGRHSPFGIMGRFSNFAPPQLEIFCTGADAAQIIHLDLMPVQ